MAKKVIQVPMDDDMLEALDTASTKQRVSRSKLIREACQCYLEQLTEKRLDTIYQEGYRKVPETPGMGEAQASLAAQVLSEESW